MPECTCSTLVRFYTQPHMQNCHQIFLYAQKLTTIENESKDKVWLVTTTAIQDAC